MKREIAGKLMLCIAAAVIIAAVDLATVNYIVRMKIRLVNVPVACKDLHSGHVIDKEEIELISVPEVYVLEHAFTQLTDVIGKKVASQAMIPAGSLFYESQLEK